MAPGLRSLTAREVLQALTAFGFEVVATRGSHAKLRRILPGGERQVLTLPLHRELAPGTLRAIFRQATRYIPEGELRPWFFKD
ncbi:MAG TPA: type II toxin-antitoxin system HicA family toxin [bacterium]|jgi:predicted RNA binding protein YcfA (HicA-like mRNA interferase family)|nr:type II toxin-antitoxin system HicA family toxin [bacterium]